uniref:Immunoglobulin domain-containing protein n=1 Tax=Astatotilapia calliptera TaxID=8154 RepID=A0A3P8Q540_ASTCA
EFQTSEVQAGENVTLQCPRIYTYDVTTFCEPSFCYGFKNGLFEMSSNVTSVFLKIKQVNISDAGLYFCGFYTSAHTVFSSATELRIQRKLDFSLSVHIMLGVVTALLTIVVVILVLKVRKLQTGKITISFKYDFQNLSPDDLNYAALSFQTKAKRSWRSATQRELEPHVVYAATR